MLRNDKPRRTEVQQIRLTLGEREQLHDTARARGISVSELLREAIFGSQHAPLLDGFESQPADPPTEAGPTFVQRVQQIRSTTGKSFSAARAQASKEGLQP